MVKNAKISLLREKRKTNINYYYFVINNTELLTKSIHNIENVRNNIIVKYNVYT